MKPAVLSEDFVRLVRLIPVTQHCAVALCANFSRSIDREDFAVQGVNDFYLYEVIFNVIINKQSVIFNLS